MSNEVDRERWQRVKEVFVAACDLDAAQRAAFLEQHDDPELVRAVEQLLAAGEAAPDLLDQPAAESFGPPRSPGDTDALLGKQIGAYRVVRRIGVGGMGQVYLAARTDDQFRRDVAVKLVRPEIVSEEIVRRFAEERQTLASLEHPNIARLFDSGITDDGYPYFVMEYVDGSPIDEFCDNEALTITQRLALFQQVCTAVQFAHQNLIVHRDLKPSNVLVTRDGVPKLLDFGIAKVLHPSPDRHVERTGTCQRRLTPEYASPEQIRGEPITTRSDVYSLGVVLYQLLTGRHPYRGKSRALYELERLICEEEPERPSTAVGRTAVVTRGRQTQVTISPQTVSRMRGVHLAALRRELAGDIDAIVLKAMHISADRRYASADQLAEDVRRHLRGMPVVARPDTIGYRLRKFAARNRGTVAASVAATLALVGGIVATSWQARLANQRRDMAVAAQQHAEEEAERARIEARKSVSVVDFFQSMLGSASPSDAGPDMTVGEVVQRAADQVGADFANAPEVESAIHTAVGRTFLGLGRYDRAETHLRRSLELQQGLHTPPHADIAGRHRDLAELYYKTRALADAERHARWALQMDRVALGAGSPEIAQDLNDLGAIMRAQGDLAQAETLLREALEVRRTLGELSALAATMNNLANVMRFQGRHAESERMAREVLDIRRQEIGDRHPVVAQSIDNLGVTLATLGQYEEAAALHLEAIEMMSELLGAEHPDLFVPLSNLATVFYSQGEFDSAIPRFREALKVGSSFLPADDDLILRAKVLLGESLMRTGQNQQAEELLRQVHQLGQAHPERSMPVTARAATSLVRLYERWGRLDEAASVRDEFAKTQPSTSKPD